MNFFVNPFAKESIDNFPGVLVSLQEPVQQKEQSIEGKELKSSGSGDRESSSDQHGVVLDTSAGYTAYTLESLRAEIMSDSEGAGIQSSYDCKFYDLFSNLSQVSLWGSRPAPSEVSIS